MRNSILVVLVLLLNACGGEAFSAEFDSVGGDSGGEAGEAPVTAAGGSATAGTSGAGGMSAGQHAGGSASGGTATAGAPAGGTAPTAGTGGAACEFDPAALSAALPTELTWNSFDLAQSDVCGACAYEPCGKMALMWSEPVVKGNVVTYKASYAPNGTTPLTVRVADNTKGCGNSEYGMCDVKLTPAPISLTVARQDDGWVVTKAAITVYFEDDACTSSFGKPGELASWMNEDLQAEIAPLLTNLKIPCN